MRLARLGSRLNHRT